MSNDTSTLNGALQQLGETLATNLTTKGVTASASDGLTTLANKIPLLKGSTDTFINITPNRPYLLSDETTDLTVKLTDGLGQGLANKAITVSDGTDTYTGLTNSNGGYTLYDITVTEDTTFTATYDTVSATCLVEYCSFVDYCTATNNKENGYTQSGGSHSFDENGLILSCSSQTLNFRQGTGQVTVPFEVSFELFSNDGFTPRMYFYQGNYGTSLASGTFYIASGKPTNIRFVVTTNGITRYVNDSTTSLDVSAEVTSTVSFRVGTGSAVTGSIKYHNFKVKQL